MKKSIFIILLAITGGCLAGELLEGSLAYAQSKPLTLKECTEYALENNISLSQSKLEAENAQVDLLTAKAGRLPSVSASVGQSYNGNYFNNSAQHKTSYSGTYGVSANWTLYNGGNVTRNIEQKENTVEIQNLTVDKNGLDLKVEIAQKYVQLLYDLENITIKEEVAATSKAQWERGLEFLRAGSISKADCAKLEAQYASDKYQVTAAHSQYATDLLSLKSAMRMQREDVEIVIPAVEEERVMEAIPDKAAVFAMAMENRPEIEISQLNLSNSELALKSAKGSYYPTLSLSANSGTNHTRGAGEAFGKQLKTNWSNGVGLSLSIPIFTQRQNRSAVEKARNDVEYYRLAAARAEDDMYTQIETLYLNARNSQEEYQSAKESYKSAVESYKLVNEQFELGIKNIVELQQEKSNYTQAEQSYTQAKYKALYNLQVLKFYTGEEINI